MGPKLVRKTTTVEEFIDDDDDFGGCVPESEKRSRRLRGLEGADLEDNDDLGGTDDIEE